MTPALLWKLLFGRRRRQAEDRRREQILTWPNGVTLLRAAVSTVILVAAIIEQSHGLLFAGLACSMTFDFCDGLLARLAKVETILGAQLDGVADRIATALVAAGVVSMNPDPANVIAATAVWLQFGVMDQLLTSQFLRFGLWSPDHFYELDEPGSKPLAEGIWQRNWSVPAKLASNLPILLLAIGAWWAALGLAVALIIMRIPGYRAIRSLAEKLPEAHGKIPSEAPAFSPAPKALYLRHRSRPARETRVEAPR